MVAGDRAVWKHGPFALSGRTQLSETCVFVHDSSHPRCFLLLFLFGWLVGWLAGWGFFFSRAGVGGGLPFVVLVTLLFWSDFFFPRKITSTHSETGRHDLKGRT